MFCSKCGKPDQIANTYCRNCGDWLIDGKSKTAHFGGATPEENIKSTIFLSFISVVFALISAIALYAAFWGQNAPLAVYIAAAFCLAVAGWQASNILVNLKLQRHFKQRKETALPTQIVEKQTFEPNTAPLELNEARTDFFAAQGSITEEETKILQKIPRK